MIIDGVGVGVGVAACHPYSNFELLFGNAQQDLCAISNMMIAAATEALSELNDARIGIVTRKSHCFLTSGLIPLPSLPITRQIGPENSVA